MSFYEQMHQNKFNFQYLLFFLVFQAFALFRLVTLNIINHSQIVTASFGYLSAIIGYFRLNQEEYFINSISIQQFNVYHLKVILNLKIQTLKYIEDNGLIYGKALFLYLLLNIPANAVFIMMLIFSPMKLFTYCVFCVVVLLQLAVVFAVHLFTAFLSIKFHSPVKRIMQFQVKSKPMKGLNNQLKLIFYIEQMHTSKPYTINYGKFGGITFSSFGKHLFYYLKFIFFSFRIMQPR